MTRVVHETVPFSSLLGKTLAIVERREEVADEYGRGDGEGLAFVTSDGEGYLQYHGQDCCETVQIESIVGDLADLIGHPILMAEEVSNSGEGMQEARAAWPEDAAPPEYVESFTWTFYKLATVKGAVTIRWLGESNGYYGESVDLYRVFPQEPDQ